MPSTTMRYTSSMKKLPPASPMFALKRHEGLQAQHSGWPVPSLGALHSAMTPNVHEATQHPSQVIEKRIHMTIQNV